MYELSDFGTNVASHHPVRQHYSGPKDEKNGMSEGIVSIIYNRDDVQCSSTIHCVQSTLKFLNKSYFSICKATRENSCGITCMAKVNIGTLSD